jgi:hypothetical protein
MPPIPEDAVVIADYMLMADYVKQTDVEPTEISKGVRYVNGSRDHFCGASNDLADGVAMTPPHEFSQYGLTGGATGYDFTGNWKLPFFGTTGQVCIEDAQSGQVVTLGGATATKTLLDSEASGDNENNQITISGNTNGDVTLGLTNIEITGVAGGNRFYGHHVVTPIHTSSHYQTFETPFLHELVGGDRNMEQTNLVVTPDGKTWDEVTRDVSYMGKSGVSTQSSTQYDSNDDFNVFTWWRGISQSSRPDALNKDFAIAYDRIICLKDGRYLIQNQGHNNQSSNITMCEIYINGAHSTHGRSDTVNYDWVHTFVHVNLKRGDYIQSRGRRQADKNWNLFSIARL